MKIHEYQAREIFRQHGLPVPQDRVAETAEQAEAAALPREPPITGLCENHNL